MNVETINNLRASVERLPNDVSLRLSLAQALLAASENREAENEFKKVLTMDNDNLQAKCGLAKSSFELREYSTAFSILEEVCKQKETGSEYHTLYAKLLIREIQEERVPEAITG